MRIWAALLILAFGQVSTTLARRCPVAPGSEIRIGKLTIISNTLPEQDRQRIIARLEHRTLPRDEIQTCVTRAVSDLGYVRVVVEQPEISFAQHSERKIALVTVRVDEGLRYRIGDIQFENATQFPPSRLRPLFPLKKGAVYESTAIGKGLDQLMKIYVGCGYTHVTEVPSFTIDEPSRSVNLTITIDEGERSTSRRCS